MINILRNLYLKNNGSHQENSLLLYAQMRLGEFEHHEVEAYHHKNRSKIFQKLVVSSENFRFGQLLRRDEDYFLIFEVK